MTDATLIEKIRALASAGMSWGLLADDYCSQIVALIDAAPAIDAAPVSEQTLRTLVYQIEDLKPSKHKDNAENAIAILRNAFRKAIDAAGAKQQLSNLLARIHRDGGHYEAEHGTDKAVDDADTIVANLNAAADAAGTSSNMTYAQIAEKLSNDGYSKQADVIRQIVKTESGK